MPSWVWVLLGIVAVALVAMYFLKGTATAVPSGNVAEAGADVGGVLNPTVRTTAYGK